MKSKQASGIAMLIGFGLIATGFALSPPNLYQESDLAVQLQIITTEFARFAASQVASGAGIVTTTFGYVLLTVYLRGRQNAVLIYTGAAAFILASVAVMVIVYQSLVDPASFLERAFSENTSASLSEAVFTWSTIAGHFLYGIVYLRGNFPMWLGYLTVGSAALATVAVIIITPFIAEVLFLLPLVTGIVLVRHKGAKP
ncbi:MAG TPA: hypothetical protein VI524_15230 [Anaerolineales bacterium]|nr:hypothetical protein [Anaerolineales bacterium]